MNYKLVWDCLQSLMELSERNRDARAERSSGDEISDRLTKRGSDHPFIGHEKSCGISDRTAKWAQGLHDQKSPGTLEVHTWTKTW
jgi:hypothetical protein